MKALIDRLADAARAYEALCVCYRLGTVPSEKLFDRIDKAQVALREWGRSQSKGGVMVKEG